MTDIYVFYSKEKCPYCEKLEELFKKKDTKYIKLTLDKDFNREEFNSLISTYTNTPTFPQIFKNGEYIGSYTNYMRLRGEG